MNKLPLDIQIQFFNFYDAEISVGDFEKWLYSKKDLEPLLDNATYIDLLSLNFNDPHVKLEIRKIIDSFLDFGKFEERKLRKFLADLIYRTDNFAKSLIDTYDFYCKGYNFFDNLGLGYGLTFSHEFWDYSDWENLSSEQKKNRIDRIYPEVKSEAELILKWLDERKIVLTGETNEIGHYDYIDDRTEAERKLRTIETIRSEENKESSLTTSGVSTRAESAKSKDNPLNKIWSWVTSK